MTRGREGVVKLPGSDKQRARTHCRSGRLCDLYPDALREAHHVGLNAGALDAQTVVGGAALLGERAMFEQAFRLLDRATQKLNVPARTYV